MQFRFKSFWFGALAVCAGAVLAQAPAPAAAPSPEPSIFVGADKALGKQLIEEKKCAACHAAKFGGDASAVYRPGKRITNAGALRGMVEQCNSEMNLGMFPEEVTAIAAVLNEQHYRFR